MSNVSTKQLTFENNVENFYKGIPQVPFDHMSDQQLDNYTEAAELLDKIAKDVKTIRTAGPAKSARIFKHADKAAVRIFKLVNGIDNFDSEKFLATRFDLVNGLLIYKDHQAGMPNPITLKTIIEKLGVEEI